MKALIGLDGAITLETTAEELALVEFLVATALAADDFGMVNWGDMTERAQSEDLHAEVQGVLRAEHEFRTVMGGK